MICWVGVFYFYVFFIAFNTLRPREDGRHFPDDIFNCIFLNEKVWILIKISLKFVPKGPINNIPSLVQIMAWRRPGDEPLSEPMMVRLPTDICVTWPQWVNENNLGFTFVVLFVFEAFCGPIYFRPLNSLWPGDIIWRHWCGSTLA